MNSNLRLDQLDDFALKGRDRLDFNRYNLKDYEKVINENIIIIGKLIIEMQESLEKIQSQKIKSVLLYFSRDLINSYRKTEQSNVKKEYLDMGVREAAFICHNFVNKFKHLTSIINFMSVVYNNYSFKDTSMEDKKILWELFLKVKEACNLLGIHSSNSISLPEEASNLIAACKKDEEYDGCYYFSNATINTNDEIADDIMVFSIPYSITVPEICASGKSELNLTEWKISCKKEYLEKLQSGHLK